MLRFAARGEPQAVAETDKMCEPMILPLDVTGKIYALQDEKGNTIGTGTREVCEVLLYIITKSASGSVSGKINGPIPHRPNVRAAITV